MALESKRKSLSEMTEEEYEEWKRQMATRRLIRQIKSNLEELEAANEAGKVHVVEHRSWALGELACEINEEARR